MKILLFYPNIRHESLIPPSIALLSRILKNEGHEVALFDSTDYEIDLGRIDTKQAEANRSRVDPDRAKSDRLQVIPTRAIERDSKGDVFQGFLDMVSDFGPSLIAVTSTESTFLLATAILGKLREIEHIPTVLGGVFATKAPWLALRYPEIDMCIIGEGEETLLNLCNTIERGQSPKGLAGLHVKDGGNIVEGPPAPIADINKNPTNLDIGLFDDIRFYRPMRGKIWRMLSVETHRGCPYTCTFCNSPGQNQAFGMDFFRKKSPDKIREEILYYRDVWKIEYVFFWADTFLAWSRKEFDAFCEMYQDIQLPFWCQTRVETITEYHMKRLMDVGLDFISFGLEHGNEDFRRSTISRDYTNADFIRRMQIVADYGMSFNVNNIVGFPDETRELVFETIELNRALPPALSMLCNIFMPFHGTVLHQVAVERGFIPPDGICPSNNDDAILNMSSMSRREITALSKVFSLYVRFPKPRWPEIRRAEASTDEGRKILARLRAEYQESFLTNSVIASA